MACAVADMHFWPQRRSNQPKQACVGCKAGAHRHAGRPLASCCEAKVHEAHLLKGLPGAFGLGFLPPCHPRPRCAAIAASVSCVPPACLCRFLLPSAGRCRSTTLTTLLWRPGNFEVRWPLLACVPQSAGLSACLPMPACLPNLAFAARPLRRPRASASRVRSRAACDCEPRAISSRVRLRAASSCCSRCGRSPRRPVHSACPACIAASATRRLVLTRVILLLSSLRPSRNPQSSSA